ncbi:hypothetical protein [Magnetospirillum sulfuroxidans]|uniref:Methyl-accepting chemotaxis protein n=1 Tax=Magnetospirillum sulfuroxidans TaxID=611300 RepID=A0ABS5I9D9_9PROT|nr:hypothetical protein [Magnetospirillum sulfuroxidans]MBR9970767.1 hypothetical protein [Magnetospirillum sulfuroxidans]
MAQQALIEMENGQHHVAPWYAVGTQEVTGTIARVSAAAYETGNTAREVLSAAASLAQNSNTLETQVDHFVSDIRAGR